LVKDDSICYELGTSTGVLSYKLAERFKNRGAKFIGIDIEEDMISLAKKRYILPNLDFTLGDILEFEYRASDFITSYYVVQFIRPSYRQLLIDRYIKLLKIGGWKAGFITFGGKVKEGPRIGGRNFPRIFHGPGLFFHWRLLKFWKPKGLLGPRIGRIFFPKKEG